MVTAKDRLEFDEESKLQGLTTLIFFTQYQSVTFEQKDFAYFQKFSKVAKLLDQLSKLFDTSSLALAILQSSFNTETPVSEI